MKILIVSDTSDITHGRGRYTTDLVNALREHGHEVVIANEWLKTRSIRSLSNSLTYLRPGFWVGDSLLLRAILRSYKPEVIHFTVEPYALLLPFVPVGDARVFVTMHGTYSYLPALVSPIWRPLYRLLCGQASRHFQSAVAVSNHTRKQYLARAAGDSRALPAEKIQVIHNGIAFIEFQHCVTKNPDHVFTLITVGAVKARKGILQVIQALAELKKMHASTFIYRIIGSYNKRDPYVQQVHMAIQKGDLKQEVEFVGHISDAALQQIYATADVFIMLPIEGLRFEGFGLAYLEANAYGIPTIGARNTAAAEAIKEGISGLLGDPYNPKEVANLIVRLEHRDGIDTEKVRAWALEHDWGDIVTAYENVYAKN